MKILKRLLDHEYRELSKFKQQADAIDKLDNEMQKLTDEQLREKTKEFKKRLQKGETLEDVLIPAFAVAREALQLYIFS